MLNYENSDSFCAFLRLSGAYQLCPSPTNPFWQSRRQTRIAAQAALVPWYIAGHWDKNWPVIHVIAEWQANDEAVSSSSHPDVLHPPFPQ